MRCCPPTSWWQRGETVPSPSSQGPYEIIFPTLNVQAVFSDGVSTHSISVSGYLPRLRGTIGAAGRGTSHGAPTAQLLQHSLGRKDRCRPVEKQRVPQLRFHHGDL